MRRDRWCHPTSAPRRKVPPTTPGRNRKHNLALIGMHHQSTHRWFEPHSFPPDRMVRSLEDVGLLWRNYLRCDKKLDFQSRSIQGSVRGSRTATGRGFPTSSWDVVCAMIYDFALVSRDYCCKFRGNTKVRHGMSVKNSPTEETSGTRLKSWRSTQSKSLSHWRLSQVSLNEKYGKDK